MASSGTRPSESANQLAVATNDFALSLYRSVQGEAKGKNVFFSPISISTALAMTHLGASGDTQTQIADVFRFGRVQDGDIHGGFKELNNLIFQHQGSYELRAANKLYAKSQYSFVKSYLESVTAFYGSAVEAVDDFASPAVTKAINDWVSEQTKGKITDLIPTDTLDSLTRLVLINAIYFKGNWQTQFKKMSTKQDVFKVLDNRGTVPTNLMIQSGKFPVAVDDANSCIVLEMPYVGGDLSMMIALPKSDDGIGELESKLSVDTLQAWSTMLLRSRPVNIFLPKFKLEESLKLNRSLASLGMPDAFDGSKANFEGISGDRMLYISDVLHKAFVDVNEEGSEAAAATRVLMKKTCALPREPEKPIVFRADHPFVFMIRHRRTQAILFMGRVMDPS